MLYSSLTNKFSREQVFTGIVGTFVAFFLLFAAVIYPNQAPPPRVANAAALVGATHGMGLPDLFLDALRDRDVVGDDRAQDAWREITGAELRLLARERSQQRVEFDRCGHIL